MKTKNKKQIIYKSIFPIFLFILCINISVAQQDTVKISDNGSEVLQGEVKIIQDSRIDTLLEQYIQQNKASMFIPGYRIQIYSGSGKRSEAKKVRAEFMKQFPKFGAELIYVEPSFKVRVGHFRIKQEGYKLFKRVIQYFPNAYFVIENKMEWPEVNVEK